MSDAPNPTRAPRGRAPEAAGGSPAKPAQTEAASPSAATFEDSARRLAEIVEELESGELPLERSLELFEEGVRLARSAQERLDRAEKRVEELLGVDGAGKPVLRDFDG